MFALRKQASLFGYNATPWAALPIAWRIGEWNPNPPAGGPYFVDGLYANCSSNWNGASFAASRTTLWLDAVYSQISVGSFVALTAPNTGGRRPDGRALQSDKRPRHQRRALRHDRARHEDWHKGRQYPEFLAAHDRSLRSKRATDSWRRRR